MAGTMTYMNRQAIKRLNPSLIVEGANRAVVVTRNHFRPETPLEPGAGLVAKYARGMDYHEWLQDPLENLADFIKSIGDSGTIAKAYIDAGPVPERELAQRAGLGWIGKNTMLIDPRRGSFLFLATVLTDLDLLVDPPFEADRCGTCRRCLDACPTQAFPDERVLDSRKCISYLTIEYKGEIEPPLAEQMGDRVFGCDACQDVCPWNVNFAHESASERDISRSEKAVNLEELVAIADEEFQARYAQTAFARPGPRGMRRNARIVQRNQARLNWSKAE
jgi:epoxyqueuosine reductase